MNNNISNELRNFGMRNLLLEADLDKLEKSGLGIGHSSSIKRDEIIDTELFEASILADARRMADFYVLYFSLENTIRKLIDGRLEEKYGLDWWDKKVPTDVKKSVSRKQDQEKDTPMAIRSEDPLSYTSFRELIDIIDMNWGDFSDTIRSPQAMKTTLSQFSLIRNIIAHSAILHEDEIARFKLLIKDWFRISG